MNTHDTKDADGSLAALATALITDLDLAGPWAWFGNTAFDPPYLATVARGRKYVLGTTIRHQVSEVDDDGEVTSVRVVDSWEAEQAGGDTRVHADSQLTFPHRAPGEPFNIITRADELAIFAVAPEATSAQDPRVYRTDVCGIRNPVATYLAAVDPSTVLALLTRVAELEARVSSLVPA